MRNTQPTPGDQHTSQARDTVPVRPITQEPLSALLARAMQVRARLDTEGARSVNGVPRNHAWMALPEGSVAHGVHLAREDRRALCGLVRDADRWQDPRAGLDRCYRCVSRAEFKAGLSHPRR